MLTTKPKRNLTNILTITNAVIWLLALITLLLVVQRAPAARGLFPILAGGLAVAIQLYALQRQHS